MKSPIFGGANPPPLFMKSNKEKMKELLLKINRVLLRTNWNYLFAIIFIVLGINNQNWYSIIGAFMLFLVNHINDEGTIIRINVINLINNKETQND
jgi:hypothetical protein